MIIYISYTGIFTYHPCRLAKDCPTEGARVFRDGRGIAREIAVMLSVNHVHLNESVSYAQYSKLSQTSRYSMPQRCRRNICFARNSVGGFFPFKYIYSCWVNAASIRAKYLPLLCDTVEIGIGLHPK